MFSSAVHTGRSSCGDGDPSASFELVGVACDEICKEGAPFWICRLLEPAYQLLHLMSLSGTLLTRDGGLLRFSG